MIILNREDRPREACQIGRESILRKLEQGRPVVGGEDS